MNILYIGESYEAIKSKKNLTYGTKNINSIGHKSKYISNKNERYTKQSVGTLFYELPTAE